MTLDEARKAGVKVSWVSKAEIIQRFCRGFPSADKLKRKLLAGDLDGEATFRAIVLARKLNGLGEKNEGAFN